MEYMSVNESQEVPRIGLGTWSLNGQKCYDTVRMAIDLGYRHIDTAEMYSNEREIGRAIKDSKVPRSAFFLTTKVWPDHLRATDFENAVDNSLARLGTYYVDLLLIHWPNPSIALWETIQAMDKVREEGKTRNIGMSNFTADQLSIADDLSSWPISFSQVPYSLESGAEEVHRTLALGTKVCAYSPLGRGKALWSPKIKGVADKHNKTPAQVALKWLVQQEGVIAIPQSADREHLKENLNVFDFTLDETDLEALK